MSLNKVCTNCNRESEFSMNCSFEDGFDRICKECLREIRKEVKRNREEVVRLIAEHRRFNKPCNTVVGGSSKIYTKWPTSQPLVYRSEDLKGEELEIFNRNKIIKF